MARHSKIKTKLVVAMMTVTSVGMAIILAVFIYNHLKLLEQRLGDRIQTQLDFFSQNIGPAILFDDADTANEMLATLAVDRAVLAAELRRADESLLASYRRTGAGSDIVDDGMLHFSRAVVFDGESMGELNFVVTRSELRSQVVRMISYSISVYGLSFLLVYLLALRAQRVISQPIIELNHLSQQVAERRDYSLRADVHSDDEIGELTEQFNRMLEQISQRDQMLEKKVGQRTAELEKLADEFRHRAFHDTLTGLRNRAFLADYFEQAMAHAERNKSFFALLLLDLDNFKTINDTMGHDAGDELLCIVARRLRQSLRREDLIIRLGGDEFVVLLENIKHPSHVRCATDLVIETVRQDCVLDDQRVQVTVSIGGSMYPEHGDSLNTLKRNADIAMYRAKELGRNQLCMFEHSMEDAAVQRLIVLNDLREAISDQQLELYYQPKVDVRSGEMVGCEALVRWQHPGRGLLAPDSFIPEAEECGLIRELDYYVLAKACQQVASWQRSDDLSICVAINLSGVHFSDMQVVTRIEHVLEDTGIAPALLEVEVTEAMLIHDMLQANEVLRQVKALGVKVSLDDFGTGYSSLSYLRTLPVDEVKLDRSFVNNLLKNTRDEQLIAGIIAMTRGLGLDIIAEGVETVEQEQRLLELGCYLVQGYYYQKPCPSEQLLAWVKRRQSSR